MSYWQIIYNRLRQNGISEAGALGILGNFEAESNCEPFRLQGDFNPYRTASKSYVQGVTSGSISRQSFSQDQKGFGIYQLTYWSRKQGYYDFWKSSGKALDDAELQVDYALKEMRESYPQLLAFLKATNDVFTATSRVCREFERPAFNNIDSRFSNANKIKYAIDLNNWEDGGYDSGDYPAPDPTPLQPDALELRTIDKNCSGFDEVWLLKALLLCRGYTVDSKDAFTWDSTLTDCVKDFQTRHSLGADGIVGSKTWSALFERG